LGEIGYFFVGNWDENYPNVGGAIVVDPDHPNRPQLIQAIKGYSAKNNTWRLYGNIQNEDELVWAGKFQSLKEFINSDDNIGAIQKLFLEVLSDVEAFQKDYPDLSWD
jgi:hypothetical protein